MNEILPITPCSLTPSLFEGVFLKGSLDEILTQLHHYATEQGSRPFIRIVTYGDTLIQFTNRDASWFFQSVEVQRTATLLDMRLFKSSIREGWFFIFLDDPTTQERPSLLYSGKSIPLSTVQKINGARYVAEQTGEGTHAVPVIQRGARYGLILLIIAFFIGTFNYVGGDGYTGFFLVGAGVLALIGVFFISLSSRRCTQTRERNT